MVEIHLKVNGTKIPFLSVPDRDALRLASRPFKWLRFVIFCICGAHGELHKMSDDTLIDYNSITMTDVWYNPQENFIFVDFNGLNDRMTTTTQTPRRHTFRTNVLARDGDFCAATGVESRHCDAAHLVPRSKGDNYILKVFDDRSIRYNSPSPISGIDDIQNGVLLAKTLHSMLADGSIALIKTPNFGLEPTDIVRVDRGSSALHHITLQQLKAPADFDPVLLSSLLGSSMPASILLPAGANVDLRFRGTETLPPSDVIVDYMYGVAAFKSWGVEAGREIVKGVYESHYKPLLAAPSSHSSNGGEPGDDGDNGGDDDDDPRDVDYDPKHHNSTRRGTEMAIAIDKLNAYMMLLQGISPEDAAKRWGKQMEEEEQIAQQASRNKVMEWMRTVDVA